MDIHNLGTFVNTQKKELLPALNLWGIRVDNRLHGKQTKIIEREDNFGTRFAWG